MIENHSSLPETSFEQRLAFYDDVESLINPGFLAHSVRIGDTVLSLRNTNPRDFFLLRHRCYGSVLESDWICWTLASLTWMVNGQMIMGKSELAPFLFKQYKKMHPSALKRLRHVTLGLFERYRQAIKAINSYCLEDYSRSTWLQYGRGIPCGQAQTGISVSEYLGHNAVQRMWQAFNLIEDMSEMSEERWSIAYMSASVHSKKVQSIINSQKAKRERRLAQRQDVKDSFYYWQAGLLDEQSYAGDSRGGRFRLKSHEELAEEYRRWVEGDEDFHDAVVRQYKERIIQRFEQEEREREEALKALQEEGQDVPMIQSMIGDKDQVALTPDQIREYLKERRGGAMPGVKKVYDDLKSKRDYVTRMHVAAQELKPQKGYMLTEKGAVPVGTPQGTLSEQLEGRGLRVGPPNRPS